MNEAFGSPVIPDEWDVAVGLTLYDEEAVALGKLLVEHATHGSVLEGVLHRLRCAHRERRNEQAKTRRQMEEDADQLEIDMVGGQASGE